MDIDSHDPELVESFGKQPPDIMGELESMLRLYSITPEELFFKWESYSMRMGLEGVKMDYETAQAFHTDVRNQLDKEMRGKARMQQTPSVQRTPRPQANGGDVFGLFDGLTATPRGAMKRKFETPAKSRTVDAASPLIAASSPLPIRTPLKPQSAAPEVATPFKQRTNAGDTLEVLNPQIPKPVLPLSDESSSDSRIRFQFNMELRTFSYRNMYQKLAEASEVMDQRIDEFAAEIQEEYKIPDERFGDPSMPSPDEIYAVGRIVSDALEGRLNPKSVMLESSRMTGAGARTTLNLDAVKSFALFPGQIVAVKGVNSSGDYFSVSEILEPPKLPPPSSSAEELADTAQRISAGPVSLTIASGPYTTDDNLLFEALDAICTKAAETRPDVMILTGPFIDSEHPQVQEGDFDLGDDDPDAVHTLEDLFKHHISPKIRKIPSTTMIVMIPSLRDVVLKHLSYPQEQLKRKPLDLPPNVKCLPNPSMFSVNEVVIGVSTADILFDMTRTEISRHPSEPNPPARLTSHVLSQRSFYPLFPAAPNVAIDIPHLRLADLVNITPDVLVLPSIIAPFAKVVNGVVAVNPGFASKKRAPGTVVEMAVCAPEMEGAREGEARAHGVYKRARVEMLRI